MSISIKQVAKKLTEQSRKGFYDPYQKIVFPETLEKTQWFLCPELISIYGQPEYTKLSVEEQQRLSFYETVNFFSLNIHGERALMEGLTHRLYETEVPEISEYIHHFVDEENKHMYYFGTFCQKYAGKIYPDRKIVFEREYLDGQEEFLFFIKIFIFEEIVDYYNLKSANDDRLHPLARQIHQNHHEDEVRHLAFGRVLLKELWDTYSPKWSAEAVEETREYIRSYYKSTWKEYFNPDIYKDAGLPNPYQYAQQVFETPLAHEHRLKVSRTSVNYLKKCGILLEDIAL